MRLKKIHVKNDNGSAHAMSCWREAGEDAGTLRVKLTVEKKGTQGSLD